MKLIRGIANLNQIQTPCVATIGAFDGMHLGHQAVLTQLKKQAQQLRIDSAVVLFEPQPKEFFAGGKALPRITLLRDKLKFLDHFGIDIVVCLRFNQKLAALPADIFIDKIVLALQPKHLVIGDDFRFGKGRQGDFAMLALVGKRYGFSVEDTKTLANDQGRISSSQVRIAIQHSNFDLAQQLLGRPYSLYGKVQHGAKLGRTLGFPTINLKLDRHVVVSGIYQVKVTGLRAEPLIGAASIGTRPAVGGDRYLLEVYLLDFSGDCYGQRVEVIFDRKLRDEQDFASLQALKEQMQRDIEQVRLSALSI